MKRARINVELSRHACLDETLCVLDIFVNKKIECANWNVGRRQICQIGSPRRRRIGRYVGPTPVAAQVGFPAQVVALAIPHPWIGDRMTGGGNVTIIDHRVDEKLESDPHFSTITDQQRQPRSQAAPTAGAANGDTRWLNVKLVGMAKEPL